MSWTESEKLNEWLLRAYDNGRREERERIIKLLTEKSCDCDSDNCKGWFLPDAESLIALIKGEQS